MSVCHHTRDCGFRNQSYDYRPNRTPLGHLYVIGQLAELIAEFKSLPGLGLAVMEGEVVRRLYLHNSPNRTHTLSSRPEGRRST